MLAQAAGLALLSALSPTALLITAVYLGSARPELTSFFYLAGAVLMSIVMGVVVLIALRSAGLNHPDQHEARYGATGVPVPSAAGDASRASSGDRLATVPSPSAPHAGATERNQSWTW